MNSINPIPSVNTPHTGAFEAWYNATSLHCLVDAVKRIWDGVLELLQQIYSFLTCAGPSTEPRATTTLLQRAQGLPQSPEIRVSESMRNQLAQLGGATLNGDRLTTMVLSLRRDLIAHDLLADVDDLVQSNNVAPLTQSLQEFLRTEDSAGVIEAVRRVIPTRYAGFVPRYPIVLPEIDEQFTRYDLLRIKRFHFWLNTVADGPIALEDLQRLIRDPDREISDFAFLAHRLRTNGAWDVFLDAISHDRAIVKRLATDISTRDRCGIQLPDLFDDLRVQHPIAFPSGAAYPGVSILAAEPINEEERNLISGFQLWLRENFQRINAEVNINRYLQGLEQEMAAAPQNPDLLRGLGERNRRYRSYALIVKRLHERRGFQDFCRRIRYDERLIALLPEAIRSGNLVPLYQRLECECSEFMSILIEWIGNPFFYAIYSRATSPTVGECVRLLRSLLGANARDRFLTLILGQDQTLGFLPRLYLDELLPEALVSGNIEPILAAMDSPPLSIVQTISPYPICNSPDAVA